MLNLLASDISLRLSEKQNLSLSKNAKLKNVLLKIHELSPIKFQKLIGLRDIGASTMNHLEMVTWKSILIKFGFLSISFSFRNDITSIHPKIRAEMFEQHIWRLPFMSGSEMLPSSLVIQPQQQNQHLPHSRKEKNTKLFTGKAGQRKDVT